MGRRKNYPWDSRVDNQMTNLVCGLLARIIFVPFLLFSSSKDEELNIGEVIGASILLLPMIILTPPIWNALYNIGFIERLLLLLLVYILFCCIEIYLVYKVTTFMSKIENKYDYLIFYLVIKDYKSSYRKIRKDYFNTVSRNKIVSPKVIEIHNKIKHYQSLLDNNVGLEKEQKYRDIIEHSVQELYEIKQDLFNAFRTDYKDPIIELYCNQSNTLPVFDGYVYLSIDNKFSFRRTIKIEELQSMSNKGKMFFKTNIKPLKDLFNESIAIHFYDRYLLLMTKNDFTIVGYENIIGSYINTSVEICLGNNNSSNKIDLNRLDCIPEYRKDGVNEFVMFDVGVLQLNLYSKKVYLLFTKYDEGKVIYNLIANIKK